MSDPENFLTRWSRRKREETAEPDRAHDEQEAQRTPEPPAAEQRSAGDATPPPAAVEKTPVEPAFDLSTLPSIESITAETDIRQFLAPGVPSELRLAALRRAWAVDPKVRDFVGLNDYDFDFHTPGAIPGFGSLEMTDDLRREVARIISGWQPEPEPRPEQSGSQLAAVTAPAAEPSVSPAQPSVPVEEINALTPASTPNVPNEREAERDKIARPQDELIADKATTQRNKESAAPQQQHSPAENLQTLARRGHGRALPK